MFHISVVSTRLLDSSRKLSSNYGILLPSFLFLCCPVSPLVATPQQLRSLPRHLYTTASVALTEESKTIAPIMHAIYTSLFVLAAVAAAQEMSDITEAIKMIPACAIGCFTEGVGNSTCGPTDAYCQCTSGAADIAKVVVPCLCETMSAGTCSVEELMSTTTFPMVAHTLNTDTFPQTPKKPP